VIGQKISFFWKITNYEYCIKQALENNQTYVQIIQIAVWSFWLFARQNFKSRTVLVWYSTVPVFRFETFVNLLLAFPWSAIVRRPFCSIVARYRLQVLHITHWKTRLKPLTVEKLLWFWLKPAILYWSILSSAFCWSL